MTYFAHVFACDEELERTAEQFQGEQGAQEGQGVQGEHKGGKGPKGSPRKARGQISVKDHIINLSV